MYFSKFPKLIYDVKGNNDYNFLTNILKRVKLRSGIKSGSMLFDDYSVRDGATPEELAFKYYGDSELHWVILITNNITDRYYQWPMNQPQFEEFIKDKYSNPDGIHHYEIPRDSGRTTGQGPNDYSYLVEVNSDTFNATSISNRQYEERVRDKSRSIKLLNQKFLHDFLEEFDNLIQG